MSLSDRLLSTSKRSLRLDGDTPLCYSRPARFVAVHACSEKLAREEQGLEAVGVESKLGAMTVHAVLAERAHGFIDCKHAGDSAIVRRRRKENKPREKRTLIPAFNPEDLAKEIEQEAKRATVAPPFDPSSYARILEDHIS